MTQNTGKWLPERVRSNWSVDFPRGKSHFQAETDVSVSWGGLIFNGTQGHVALRLTSPLERVKWIVELGQCRGAKGG